MPPAGLAAALPAGVSAVAQVPWSPSIWCLMVHKQQQTLMGNQLLSLLDRNGASFAGSRVR